MDNIKEEIQILKDKQSYEYKPTINSDRLLDILETENEIKELATNSH